MISTQYINLNMVPSGVMPVLHCSQYDVGRPLGVVIYNGSESVDLSGYTVTIEGTRTDRTPVTAGVTTDGNIGVFTTTPTMTNENDTYRAKVVLTDNAGRVSSLAFVMCVDEKTMDENAEEIEEDASLYQQYTGTVQTIIAQIRGDLAAEITARQNAISAEASARQAADNTLQSNINAEASARATQDASLQSQINQLIAPSGSAPSAAEVENARIGSDGTVYPTLGDAIRTQNSLLKSQLNASLAGYGKSIASNGMPFVLVNNEYVKQDGQIAPYNGWARTTPIPVMGLESATFAFTNAATSQYCVLYDQNMSFIQQFSISGETALTIPGNAAFAMVSGNLTNMQQLVVRGLYRDVLNDTVNITAKIRESMAVDTLPFKGTSGYYLNNGVATKSANYSMTDKIPVHGIHTLHFDFGGDASARAMYNAFYDAAGTFLSAFEATYGVLEVSVPSGAYYVAFSGLTDSINKLSVTLPLEVRVEELEAGATRIKSYYEAEMQTTLETVHALMNEPCLVMPVCTDIHMYSSAYVPLQFDNMIMNMLYFSKHVRIDGVVDLGDNTDGDTVKATSLERAYYMGSEFRKITDKFYFTLGNHDDNRSAAGTTDDFTNAENYQAYYAFVDNSCQFDATYDGTNFYKDFENYKIRLISLNAMANNAYAYSSETIAWFGQTINSTPSDYAVLVISHLAPYGSLNYKGYVSTGATQIAATLESYKNNGGTIIAFIFGHTHMDYAVTSPFNLIAVASNLIEDFTWSSSDCPPGAVYNPRNPGTATEDLWDVMIIRPHSRKINLVRFGAGSDREFSY